MSECFVSDEASKTCKQSDLDRIFIATNFEEEKQSEASQVG